MPSLKGLDEDKLLGFLGSDFDPRLTSVKKPSDGRDPPKACELLPAFEGSAGENSTHAL